MTSKKSKEKKPRKLPRPNRQIPNSMIRPITALGINPAVQNARELPFYGCWAMQGWQEQGLTPVVVARRQSAERIVFGSYVVDLFCLGVKDAYARADISQKSFEEHLDELCSGAPEKISIELAHELLYGAIEYAAKLGFEPHPDFKRLLADQIIDPPETHPRSGQVTFGKNGKPLFIAGPYEDHLKITTIVNKLKSACGEGNFDYIIGLEDAG